ncbi:hypothetical protein B0F90DRAFT_1046937 [Multifurca ochricompacta]|uniref:Uncharacterized protein n=1 Tax=Multifurca ochricompacta TaxID=376703 RepID=A0AAD4M042_9AGAM|nr:hypothetical protein B0F90DRAFT_1046937 [Multifurca ochricompacta]
MSTFDLVGIILMVLSPLILDGINPPLTLLPISIDLVQVKQPNTLTKFYKKKECVRAPLFLAVHTPTNRDLDQHFYFNPLLGLTMSGYIVGMQALGMGSLETCNGHHPAHSILASAISRGNSACGEV